jgi:hypothetical protein
MSTVLHILQHALGRDEHGRLSRGATKEYRNHFCAGEGSADFSACREAVAQGLMTEHPPRAISGGDYIFTVTPLGKAYVVANSPDPPKVSRGRQRYRKWLDVSDAYDIKFGDWLKVGAT